ncbi:MAG: pro-sigmaK processing inhibitor BofA family protein [Clostridiales bacterium]|nr:pro-sigmaK processing inhibitor BofA family protein [Clostridiales bacterium]
MTIYYNTMVLEIATGFIAGLLLITLFCWLFKAKMKWYFRFALSSAFGFLAIYLLGLFGLVKLPLNPMNAFVCGFMGLPGLVLLIVVTLVF